MYKRQLIDHAWVYEPVTIADIKAYRPQTNSISSGPVSYTHLDVYKRQDVSCRRSDREIFSYDEMPDYILAVDEESLSLIHI